MSKNMIIGLVIGAVVILGGGYYLMKAPKSGGSMENAYGPQPATSGTTQAPGNTGSPAKTTGLTPGVAQGSTSGGKFDGSMQALLARGGQWKCNIDTSSDTTVSSGEVFVAGGKMRGNFSTTVKGFGDVRSYIISDGTTMYTWSTAQPMGVVMTVSKSGTPTGMPAGQGSADVTKSYSYVCDPWSVDMSMFTPPSNIQFMKVGK